MKNLGSITLSIPIFVLAVAVAACDPDAGSTDERTASSQQAVVSDGTWGYLWSQSSTGAFTADPNYAVNSSSTTAANTVEWLSTGQYQVVFPGLGTQFGGNVQVTSYGTGSEYCKVRSWAVGLGNLNLNVYVDCWSAAGTRVNGRFTVAYVRKSGTGSTGAAYVWADSPSLASYTPSSTYQFNSTGVANTITRSSAGVYSVRLPGQSSANASTQITAYGAGSEYCTFGGWSVAGSDPAVIVRCFSSAGVAKDAPFTMNFARDTRPLGGRSFVYLTADQPTVGNYTPNPNFQRAYIGGVGTLSQLATISRLSLGRYSVKLPAVDQFDSNVQVTGQSIGSGRCKVESWSGAPVTVNVRCFDAAGSAKDNGFVLAYMSNLFLSRSIPPVFTSDPSTLAASATLNCGNFWLILDTHSSGNCTDFGDWTKCESFEMTETDAVDVAATDCDDACEGALLLGKGTCEKVYPNS